jgi:pSer/pThr/pTyr-binding forkhead associated (FHA) protein
MIARLVSLDGRAEIPLDRPLLLVGRDPRCDARIDSPRVSRVHCYLAPRRGGVTARDLGSTNGIRINGLRVGEGLLRDGDLLSVGDFRYRLEDDRQTGLTHISSCDNNP